MDYEPHEPPVATNIHVGRRGRPSRFDDPEYTRLVAHMFVIGMGRQEMADELGVSTWTITQWRRHPAIKAVAAKLIEDRILSVTRKVDAEIEGRLQNASALTTKELLEIRKEFLGGALRMQTEQVDEDTVDAAMKALEDNPNLMQDIAKALGQNSDE
jgi:hypothetical protein